jgi:hypothetical protein
LISSLVKQHSDEIRKFLDGLSAAVLRPSIVLALHGKVHEITTVADAINSSEVQRSRPFRKAKFGSANAAMVEGRFADKESAVAFRAMAVVPKTTDR